jgi:hypothetical protein
MPSAVPMDCPACRAVVAGESPRASGIAIPIAAMTTTPAAPAWEPAQGKAAHPSDGL